MSRRAWTAAEVAALGVRTDVPTAGSIIAGLGRDESYRAVKRGTFPVPVIKVGRHLVVPMQPILTLLQIDAPETSAAGPEPPGPAATIAASAPLPDEDKAQDEHNPGHRR